MQEQEELLSAYFQWDGLHQTKTRQRISNKEGAEYELNRLIESSNVTNTEIIFPASDWIFSKTHKPQMANEIKVWIQSYLGLNFDGLTVLDLGAGEGETAKLFLDHGASKVICVEPRELSYYYLSRNAKSHPAILAIYKRFNFTDVGLPYDFIKCNIKGYENELINAELTVPAVVEVHGWDVCDKFIRSGWRISNNDNLKDDDTRSYAFWMC